MIPDAKHTDAATNSAENAQTVRNCNKQPQHLLTNPAVMHQRFVLGKIHATDKVHAICGDRSRQSVLLTRSDVNDQKQPRCEQAHIQDAADDALLL